MTYSSSSRAEPCTHCNLSTGEIGPAGSARRNSRVSGASCCCVHNTARLAIGLNPSGLISLEGFNPIASLAVLWTQQQLAPETLEFLRALPAGPISPVERLQCVHGSARDEDEYVMVAREAYALLAQSTAPLTFFGHTHIQCGFCVQKQSQLGQVIVPNYQTAQNTQKFQIYLREDTNYMINPGSIGQPRDNDPRAAFMLYDSGDSSITFYRVPYNIPVAQKKIRAAGLPDRLADRLAEGR